MNTTRQYPYRLARLHDAGGDLSKRWYIDFQCWDSQKQQLVRRRKWIPASFRTKAQRTAQAQRLIRAINKLLIDGYHLSTEPTTHRPAKQMTWIQAFDWVYAHRQPTIRKRSQQTLELVRRELKVWLQLHGLQDLPLQYVQPQHCDDYMQHLRHSRQLGNATYNNYLSFLKLNFNYLVSQDHLTASPARKLRPLKIDEPSNVHFPPAIKAKLLENYPEELQIMAQYIYYSFIRPGELRQLQVRHIQDQTIFVPGHIAKNGKSAHVLISPALQQLLRQLQIRSYPPSHYLITHHGRPGPRQVSVNFFSARHRQVRQQLQLSQEYTLYCWKHTGVTDTYQHTRDIEFVSRQCRHASLDMTKHYLRGLGQLLEYPLRDQLPALEW